MQDSEHFDFDVVVIGSGFGGGTAALRLTQSGKRVLVLERGRRFRGENMPYADAPQGSVPFPKTGDTRFFWGRQFFHPDKERLGLFEVRQLVNLQALLGAGVGGGSLIWANVVVEAPADVFAHDWPEDLSLDALKPYYRKADSYLKPSFTPGIPGLFDVRKSRRVRRAEQMLSAAESVGKSWQPVRVAVKFGNETSPLPNGHGAAKQLGCNYCGMCSAGCPQNAKNTVDVTYVAEAEALGAEVRTLHEVTSIEPLYDATSDQPVRYRVHFNRYEDDGTLAEEGSVEASRVVVSAGAFGSTELLLISRRRGYLPDISQALGSRFSINGNVLSGALKRGTSHKEALDSPLNTGPAITGMIDYGSYAIEDYPNPIWANGLIGGTASRRLRSFVLSWLGHKPSRRELKRKAQDLLCYVGVGRDSASGRLKLNAFNKLKLFWPGGVQHEPVLQKLHTAMAELAYAQGRQYVPDIFSVFKRAFTYHPLGGCPMGNSAQHGVVDSYGRVFNYPGLYVADGSVIPTALGRNPAYTIAAVCERIAEGILDDIKHEPIL